MSLFCILFVHDWKYITGIVARYRECKRCQKLQYWNGKKWLS